MVDPADGSDVVFGTEHAGQKENPAFVRGRNAVVYIVGRQDAPVFLYDLDTGRERRVVQLKGNVQMPCAAVVGPRSEYLLLRGDLTGDGLSDFSIKPLWTDEPARAIWSSPTCGAFRKRLAECFDEMAFEFKPHLDEAMNAHRPIRRVDTRQLARYIVTVIEGAIMLSRTHG